MGSERYHRGGIPVRGLSSGNAGGRGGLADGEVGESGPARMPHLLREASYHRGRLTR